MNETPVTDRLYSLAQTARTRRLEGTHHRGHASPAPLIGKCFDNAFVAFSVYSAADMSPALIEGSTVRVAESVGLSQADLEILDIADELAGAVHYWLTLTANGQQYTIDIASDNYGTVGEIIVSESPPEGYYQYPDSQDRGMELLGAVRQRGDRCRRCGDHQYTLGGCSACAEYLSEDLS